MSIQEEILKGIKEGKRQVDIAQRLGSYQEAISRQMKKIAPEEIEKARQEALQKEQEEILKRMRQGISQENIGKELGVTQSTISNKIEKIDSEVVEEAKAQGEKVREDRKAERAKMILEGIKAGKTQEEMIEEFKLSKSTIVREIRKIDPEEIEEAKSQGREAKKRANEQKERNIQKVILEKKNQGKNQNDIAKEIGVSPTAISIKISKVNIRELSYEMIKEKLNNCTITKEDIEQYSEQIKEKIEEIGEVSFKEIILMANIYIKTNQVNEAIRFINSLINNKQIKYLDKDKLVHMKQQLELMQKKQRIRELLKKSNISSRAIATIVGVSEIEVIKVKREMEAKEGIEI